MIRLFVCSKFKLQNKKIPFFFEKLPKKNLLQSLVTFWGQKPNRDFFQQNLKREVLGHTLDFQIFLVRQDRTSKSASWDMRYTLFIVLGGTEITVAFTQKFDRNSYHRPPPETPKQFEKYF